MRFDRLPIRLVKLTVLLGCIGLLVEGALELPKLLMPFTAPPSVPGQSKIIEHFALQHVLFPLLGVLLVFSPISLRRFLASRLTRAYLAALALLVTLPEALVSLRGDLFRPYPFDLHAEFLKTIQMTQIGPLAVNMLQLQHLLFAHLALMGTLVVLAITPESLHRFAGPRTGEGLFRARELPELSTIS